MIPPSAEEIAAVAHRLHLDGGSVSGTSVEDWLCAEYFLTEFRSQALDMAEARLLRAPVPAKDSDVAGKNGEMAHDVCHSNGRVIRKRSSASRGGSRRETVTRSVDKSDALAAGAARPLPPPLQSPAAAPIAEAMPLPVLEMAMHDGDPSDRWKGNNE